MKQLRLAHESAHEALLRMQMPTGYLNQVLNDGYRWFKNIHMINSEGLCHI